MTPSGSGRPGSEREPPPENLGPQTVLERQESLGQRILAMQRRRRERFLRRARLTSLRQEASRAAYLVACLLFDALVVPEPVFLLPNFWGWGAVIAGLVAAIRAFMPPPSWCPRGGCLGQANDGGCAPPD